MRHNRPQINRLTPFQKALATLLVVVALFTMLGMVEIVKYYLNVNAVYANPNDCPEGQKKKEGCTWVQHVQSGNCMWLPSHASSIPDPWKPVLPPGSCPQASTSTLFPTVVPTATCTYVATKPFATSTPMAPIIIIITQTNVVPASTRTSLPVPNTDPQKDTGTAVSTPTRVPPAYCDQCSIQSTMLAIEFGKLHALQTLAAK